MKDYLNRVKKAAEYINERMISTPYISMVLGSGLGSLADTISNRMDIPYEEIPHFPKTTVPGHAGKLILGEIGGRPIIAMRGRFHYYEGWNMQEVVFPLRVFRLLGVENLILTNAAGGINTQFKPGDLMLIKDHIGFFAENPLRGENMEEFGPRFPDMSQVYNRDLVDLSTGCALKLRCEIRRGVYAYTRGPSFETPAEIRALRDLGADAVGMSTVPEAITARHMGMNVLGISCITNMAAGVLERVLNHDEVMETGKRVEEKFSRLVTEIVKNWP